MSELKRDVVVVPLDFSEESENALKVAVELTGDPAKVKTIHVLPPLEAISPAVMWGDLSDDTRQQSAREYAEKFLSEHGAAGAGFHVCVGSPAHEITRYADKLNADLIVISSHGYHGIKRMLLGSVAESVIRHAHCGVLVLRRQDAD
jgi:nucleotide-binding universal stress UspA family protein